MSFFIVNHTIQLEELYAQSGMNVTLTTCPPGKQGNVFHMLYQKSRSLALCINWPEDHYWTCVDRAEVQCVSGAHDSQEAGRM